MEKEFRYLVGIDLGTQEHHVAVLNSQGHVMREFKFQHNGGAIESFASTLLELAEGDSPDLIAVAVESPRGAVVDVLLERGIAVFAINPKQLDRFRDRYSMAGAKDDRRDAFVLADSARTDLKLFRRVAFGDPLLVQLRELCRVREELQAEVIMLGNRLRELLQRYFPQHLELGSLYEEPWLLELVELAPTPTSLCPLRRAKVATLLRRNRIRRIDAEEVLTILRARPLPAAPGVVEALSTRALLVLPRLRLALALKRDCEERMQKLLGELAEWGKPEPLIAERVASAKTHRDATVLLSLPGVGLVVGATMLAEASTALADRDYHALRVRCGVAPVTKRSGKLHTVSMRYACEPRLRVAVHYWAGTAVNVDAPCRAQYARLRAAGHSHGRALRGVGDRLLAMLVAMLKSQTTYDPNRRCGGEAPAPTPTHPELGAPLGDIRPPIARATASSSRAAQRNRAPRATRNRTRGSARATELGEHSEDATLREASTMTPCGRAMAGADEAPVSSCTPVASGHRCPDHERP